VVVVTPLRCLQEHRHNLLEEGRQGGALACSGAVSTNTWEWAAFSEHASNLAIPCVGLYTLAVCVWRGTQTVKLQCIACACAVRNTCTTTKYAGQGVLQTGRC
jgi:hypothetical protein